MHLKIRVYTIMFAFVVTLVIAVFYFFSNSREASYKEEPTTTYPSVIDLTLPRNSSTNETAKTTDTLPQTKNADSRTLAIAPSIQAYLASSNQIMSVSKNINREELRKEIFASMVSLPGNIELATNIAGDIEFAIEIFGERQAQARVTSIMLLNYLASQGDSAPLLAAIKQVSVPLEAKLHKKGIQHDYTDMVSGYFKAYDNTYGTANFVANIDNLLSDVNYSKNLADSVLVGLVLSGVLKGMSDEQKSILRFKFGDTDEKT